MKLQAMRLEATNKFGISLIDKLSIFHRLPEFRYAEANEYYDKLIKDDESNPVFIF